MKKWKITMLALLIAFNAVFFSGCWNYREISEMSIVVGLAIDKSKDKKSLDVTFEIIDFKNSSQVMSTKTINFVSNGKTVFDAIRNAIKLTGHKLYWGHAQVAIISEEIAREDIIPAIDLMTRDHEISSSIKIFVAKGATAKDILCTQSLSTPAHSVELCSMIKNTEALGEIPDVPLYELIKSIQGEGIEPVIPSVSIVDNIQQKSTFGEGSAIFKGTKLVGFLDGNETKMFLFVRNKIDLPLILVKLDDNGTEKDAALEIFRSSTKVKPNFANNKVSISIEIKTLAKLNEIPMSEGIINQKKIEEIEMIASKQLARDIEEMIRHVQEKYQADIFGFGNLVLKSKPKMFEALRKNWQNEFKDIKVKVTAEIKLKSAGVYSKALEKNK